MKLIISPKEVVDIAFQDSPNITEIRISETDIIAAQTKFIKPVLGKLYEGLQNGQYPELMPFIKAALANFVKLSIIPKLSVSLGNIGIVQPKADMFASANQETLITLKNAAKTNAYNMMKLAINHIETNPELYPKYSPNDNILNRVSIASGFVL